MALTLWPTNGTFSGRQLRQALGALWGGKTAARPLGAATGVVVGIPTSIVTATSTTWTVTPFAAVLDVETTAIAGPYNVTSDANQTGSVNAAHATLPRVDLLSVFMGDTGEGDGAIAGPTVVYTAGTAAASPVAPATPTRSMALAFINVPASGGGSPTVTWVATRAVAAGGILTCQGSTYRPASPYTGQYIDDATLGLLRWNGTGWAGLKPQTGTGTITHGSGNVSVDLTVTFGTAFTVAPTVVNIQGSGSEAFIVNSASITATNFVARSIVGSGVAVGASHNVPFSYATVGGSY